MQAQRAVVCLTSTESKRLIARGVASLNSVKMAQKEGRVIVALGSTNSYVYEELVGRAPDRGRFMAGYIADGQLKTVSDRLEPLVLVKGEDTGRLWTEVLEEFEAGDVFIKGANAVDSQGFVGILLGSNNGGTIGAALGNVQARGAEMIVPVGLEKMIPSVLDVAEEMGTKKVDHQPLGMMPLLNATVITEIHALNLLTEVTAYHCASGGIGGSEGAVTLLLKGSEEEVASALDLVGSVKGEPPLLDPEK